MPQQATVITPELLLTWQSDLIYQLNSQNIEYLSIAVGILITSGIIYNYLSSRSFEKELNKQAKEIDAARVEFKTEIKKGLSEISSITREALEKFQERIDEILVENKEDTLRKAQDEIIVSIANARSEISKEFSEVTKKLTSFEINQAGQSNEIKTLTSKTKSLEDEGKDMKIKIGLLETYKYSKEGQMGAILVPLEIIRTVVGTPKEWRIPDLLDTIKIHLKDTTVNSQTKIEINQTLAKLSNEYSVLRDEILGMIK